ncbi:MAG: hypothetical protein Unbinned80contig1000_28 [Prokaryotic dsDNA virus sp.]|nr:MAG: hypothetical protein Unbinned80contig1000_28 [Prokaryotic dsDNA virus sp.]
MVMFDDDDEVTPDAILEMAQAGKIRSSNDLKDFGAEMMGAIARKEVTVSAAREMRQWAELVYSLISMEGLTGGDSSVNIIGQLVQMSGEPPKKVIEAQPPKQIPEAELDSADFFTEIVEQVSK